MEFSIDVNEIIKLRILILFFAYKKELEGDPFIGYQNQLDEINLKIDDKKLQFVIGYLVDDGYLRGTSTSTGGGRISFPSGITPKGQRTVEDIIKSSDIQNKENSGMTILDKVKYCIEKVDICKEFIKIGYTIFKDFQPG